MLDVGKGDSGQAKDRFTHGTTLLPFQASCTKSGSDPIHDQNLYIHPPSKAPTLQ
jgi:hypothetical protein